MRTLHWLAGSTLVLSLIVGCNSEGDAVPFSDADPAEAGHDDHAHHHEGPNGGHIVELSDDHSVHGEFVIDEAAKVAKLYVLGEDLKTPVQATAVNFHGTVGEDEVELDFEPAEGAESAGEFTYPLEGLPSTDIEAFAGHFHVNTDGKELSGDLAHDHDHGHDHEGHDHGDHDHADHEHEEEEAPAPM